MTTTVATVTAAAQALETVGIDLSLPVVRLTETYVENRVRYFQFTVSHRSLDPMTADAAQKFVADQLTASILIANSERAAWRSKYFAVGAALNRQAGGPDYA